MTGTIATVYKLMAPVLGSMVKEITRAARYVREQGLIQRGKPGPGGGAAATPRAIAALLIGLMATASRQAAGVESSACGLLLPADAKRCQLAGSECFAGAMEHVLADPNVAAQVKKIVVSKPVATAKIEYRAGEGVSEQRFGRAPAGLLSVESVLDGGAAHKIATDLREIEDEAGVWTP